MRRIRTYLILLVLLSAPFWWLAAKFGGGLYITGMMFSPALAAVATLRLTGGELAGLGLRACGWRWLVGAWFVPVATIAFASIITIALGMASFPEPEYLGTKFGKLGLSAWPEAAAIAVLALLTHTYGAVSLTANALGEEIGWRGFFTPAAYEKWGFAGSAAIVGLVWAAWHIPLFIGSGVGEFIPFAIGIMGLSFVCTWFRLASRSLWPPIIIHGVWNACFINFWGPLLVVPEGSRWAGEDGYCVAATSAAAGLLFWISRAKAERLWAAGPQRELDGGKRPPAG